MSAVYSTAPYRTIGAGSKHGREAIGVLLGQIDFRGLLIVLLSEGRRKHILLLFQLSSFQLGITRYTLHKVMAVGNALAQTQSYLIPLAAFRWSN
ncbi:hypothetical protein H257_16658 [Aphanomyces astaci]|uniref:Uncharacterized protein n=1 Tax=Aphanomyces astaci TaxID=112090 RepID=W4FHZ4_APHAT|nr:hypothetical protein H257_16658 [Aphanomyces astaci]ETV67117.1 hypothetical protein H257_16658 [Aphanomyces astaci]|eukprot:XP_009843486.1 hypothetical protein H257_16658 [Aphanomyces astaci]